MQQRYVLLMALMVGMVMNVQASPSVTAHFKAVIAHTESTCSLTIQDGVEAGGNINFTPLQASLVTDEPTQVKTFHFLVSCPALAGEQVKLTLHGLATVPDSGNRLFNDNGQGAAQWAGFALIMGTGADCTPSWAAGNCAVQANDDAITLGTAGQALASQAVWVKAGISKGGIGGVPAPGTLTSTLTFTAAYP